MEEKNLSEKLEKMKEENQNLLWYKNVYYYIVNTIARIYNSTGGNFDKDEENLFIKFIYNINDRTGNNYFVDDINESIENIDNENIEKNYNELEDEL